LFLGLGIGALATNSPFEDLAAMDRQGSGALATEEAWVRAAEKEHSWRRDAGIAGLVLSGLMLGAATFAVVDSDLSISAGTRQEFAAFFYGLGAIDGLASVYQLTTDGPVETGLRAYEQSSGRPLWRKDAGLGRLHIALAPSGAMGTFSADF
jgi:hypothetical protein